MRLIYGTESHTFDGKNVRKDIARNAKITRLQNMVYTLKPVFVTVQDIRLQVAYVSGSYVWLQFPSGAVVYSIDKVSKLSYVK